MNSGRPCQSHNCFICTQQAPTEGDKQHVRLADGVVFSSVGLLRRLFDCGERRCPQSPAASGGQPLCPLCLECQNQLTKVARIYKQLDKLHQQLVGVRRHIWDRIKVQSKDDHELRKAIAAKDSSWSTPFQDFSPAVAVLNANAADIATHSDTDENETEDVDPLALAIKIEDEEIDDQLMKVENLSPVQVQSESESAPTPKKQFKRRLKRCEVCGYECYQTARLVAHRRIHTGEKPHCCEECGQRFRFVQSLHKHASIHSKVRPFICEHCGKAFRRSDGLKTHLWTHMDPGSRPPLPPSRRPVQLKSQNSELRPPPSDKPKPRLKCELCSKEYPTALSLRLHSKRIHTEAKPHKCELCEQRFRIKKECQQHLATHDPNFRRRQHRCTICWRRFPTLDLVHQHTRKEHTDKQIETHRQRRKEKRRKSNKTTATTD